MAIIDWPTGPGFDAAQFSLALDVSESVYQGFHTGNRTRASHAADRLRGVLTLPPVRDAVAAARREALLLGMRSNGDWLRMGLPHRKGLLGTLTGTVTVASAAVAGARSLSLQGALSAGNLLTLGSFEGDANADNVADGWSTVTVGSPTGATFTREAPAPDGGAWSQGAQATFTTTGTGQEVGVERTVTVAGPGTYSARVSVRGDNNQSARLVMEWRNSGGGIIAAATAATVAVTGDWQTLGGVLVAPAGTVSATMKLMASCAVAAGFRAVRFDAASLRQGDVGLEWPGLPSLLPGDVLAIGGNLLMVAAAGATFNDAGAGTVPLVTPLQRAVAGGAAVTHSAPTGLWELDDTGLQLDYSAGNVQRGLAVPLRQVIA